MRRSSITMKLSAMLIGILLMIAMSAVAFADDGAGIKVKLTVSEKGVIAQTKDGEAMAQKEVAVTDLDGNGSYTFEEALIAAHKEFNSEDGYENSYGTVRKLWGISTTNALFFINAKGLSTAVTVDTIQDGDYLTASINADEILYSDWITDFDIKEKKDVKVGETVTLNLKGHLGMAFTEEDMQDVNIAGVKIGTWEGGSFKQLGDAVTDADGNVSFSFDQGGTYVVTAQGTTPGVVTSWDLFSDSTLFGLEGYVKEDEDLFDSTIGVGYTETDYGEGPYPPEEVKWVDWLDWYDEPESYPYLLLSNKFKVDCPIMAPSCIIDVIEPAKPADMKVTISDQGVIASAADGSAVVEKDITVSDINKDGLLTYEEAMIAAHQAYFKDGESGFAASGGWVSKFWGLETMNALFFTNGVSISPLNVAQAEVKEGDSLYAGSGVDSVNWCDVKTSFDATEKTVSVADMITVALAGRVGMGDGNEDEPLANVQIGYWEDGEFKPIADAVTDSDGKASFTLDAGSYILTAGGNVEIANPWSGETVTTTVMAPYCFLTVEPFSIADAVVSAPAKTYTGKALTPAVTVELDGVVLEEDKDYTVAYSNNKNAGKATITVTGKGNYSGKAAGTFTIKKAAQKLKASGKTVKFKVKKVKKKKQTIKVGKLVKLTGAAGKITYTIKPAKAKFKKALKCSKTKVVLKKKTKKGSYKVKITIQAAGNKNYKAAKKVVTATIKVAK